MNRKTRILQSAWLLALVALGGCDDTEPAAPVGIQPPASCAGKSGCITTVIGTGQNRAVSDEGTLGWKTPVSEPQDMQTGPDGHLYYLDWNNHQVRAYDPQLKITRTIAGTGELGDDGAGGPALMARFNHPTGLAFTKDGSMLVAAWHNSKIRKIDMKTGILTDTCGTGKRDYGGDGGPALKAWLDLPSAVVMDEKGGVFIADQASHRIRWVDSADVIHTVVGDLWMTDTGKPDGVPKKDAQGRFLDCKDVPTMDAEGFQLAPRNEGGVIIYVRAKNPDAKEIKYPFAVVPNKCPGYADGPAWQARLNWQGSQSADPNGRIVKNGESLVIADTMNHRIRKLDLLTMTVSTLAGNGKLGYGGDGGQALEAQLNTPVDVDVGPDGTVYIADMFNHCVRAIDPKGVIRTFAGVCGKKGYSGDGGPAQQAKLARPYGIHVDPATGGLWIADTVNNRIRYVSP